MHSYWQWWYKILKRESFAQQILPTTDALFTVGSGWNFVSSFILCVNSIWLFGSCKSCLSIEKSISHCNSVLGVSIEDENFRITYVVSSTVGPTEIWSVDSYLVVLQLDRSNCSKVTGTMTYRPRTVAAVLWSFRFLVLCFISVVLLFGWLLNTVCVVIW